MKLSPAQIRILKALAEPGAVAHYMSYMGWFRPHAYWYISSESGHTRNIREATIKILTNAKLIIQKRKNDSVFGNLYAEITAAGRTVLAEIEGKPCNLL